VEFTMAMTSIHFFFAAVALDVASAKRGGWGGVVVLERVVGAMWLGSSC
jgi:hypothetical protein